MATLALASSCVFSTDSGFGDLYASTLSSSTSQAVATGTPNVQLQLVLRQSTGEAVSGLQATFASDSNSGVVQQPTAPSDGNGRIVAQLGATRQGTVHITAVASDAGTTFVVPVETTVNFGTGPVTLALSLPATQPIPAGAGTTVQITATDATGERRPDYVGVVQLTCSDPNATLPATVQFTPEDAGTVQVPNVVFTQAGPQSIDAVGQGDPSMIGTVAVAVTYGAVHIPTVTANANQILAGTPVYLTISLRDPYGNIVANAADSIIITSTDPQASTVQQGVQTDSTGVATLTPVLLYSAGAQHLTVTLPNSSRSAGVSVQVNPGAPRTLYLLTPTAVTGGTAFAVTVASLDAFGNVSPTYAGTVHFTSTNGSATLPANYTFVPSVDLGQHNFTGVVLSSGTWQITAADVSATVGSYQATITAQ